jgi:hypothetical protein
VLAVQTQDSFKNSLEICDDGSPPLNLESSPESSRVLVTH